MRNSWILQLSAIFLLHTVIDGWIGPVTHHATKKNFYISEVAANRSTARTICSRRGWTLATIMEPSEQKALVRLAKSANIKENIWIGLALYQGKNKPFGKWDNGSDFTHTGYSNWARGEPATFSTSTQTITATCVRLWYERRWKWDDYYCDFREVSKSLFACEAKNAAFYTPEDVDRIGDGILNNAGELQSTLSNIESLATAMDELLGASEEFFQNRTSESRQIFKAYDEFLENYDVNEQEFTVDKRFLEVKARKLKKRQSSIIRDHKNSEATLNNIEIEISKEVIQEAIKRKNDSKRYVQLNSVYYRNPSLFQVDDRRFAQKFSNFSNLSYKFRNLSTTLFGEQPNLQLMPNLISNVILVNIKDVEMRDLPNPVNITHYNYHQNFTPPHITDMRPRNNPKCAFWDMKMNEWSYEGCVTYYTPPGVNEHERRPVEIGQTIYCECNHMTHFAVLLDTTYIYAPDYLIAMTIAGCTLSIVCLLAAVVTILCFRQLRTKTTQQILLHVCLNLLILNILFLIGIDSRDNETLCVYSSALMHYFLLTAWAWMFLEAIFLFLSLVISRYHGGVQGKIIPFGTVMAYGIPAIIAGLTAGLTRKDKYLSEKYCWLSMEVLIPSLVIPVAIILVANITIFVSVMFSITWRSKAFRDNIDICKVRQTMRRAFCMVFILGIPWIFGFFMLLSQNPTMKGIFAVCFTVFNTTQGVAIFFFFCARQEQVRKLWLTPINKRFSATIRSLRSTRKPIRESEANLQQNSTNKTQEDDIKTSNNTSSNANNKRMSIFITEGTKSTYQELGTPTSQKRMPFRHRWY